MNIKICLITGATSGIGLETARGLAVSGFNLLLIGRNSQKLKKVSDELSSTYNVDVKTYKCDLSSIKQVKLLAEKIARDVNRLDIIINNAGGIFMREQKNVEGIEMTFALNHLSYFTLTTVLLEKLKQKKNLRIINVSSAAHKWITLNLNNLEMKNCFNGWLAYKKSKLANIYFTYHLAELLKGTTISVNCLHPGFVNTNFANNNRLSYKIIASVIKIFAISSVEGAQTSIYLAKSKLVSNTSGGYFYKCAMSHSSKASYDRGVATKLWKISEEMIQAIS